MRTNSISVNCRFAARRSHSLRKIGIEAVAGKDMPEYMLTILDDILEMEKSLGEIHQSEKSATNDN